MYKSPFVQRQSPEHKFSSGFDEKPSINLKAFRRRFRIPYKQIIMSMGEGAKAAITAADYLQKNPIIN